MLGNKNLKSLTYLPKKKENYGKQNEFYCIFKDTI